MELAQHGLGGVDAFDLRAAPCDRERETSRPTPELQHAPMRARQPDIIFDVLGVVLVLEVVEVGSAVGVFRMRHAMPTGGGIAPADVHDVRPRNRWSRADAPHGGVPRRLAATLRRCLPVVSH